MAPRHRLGDSRTRPCAEQCEEYLAFRPGCCMQRGVNCYVYAGTRKGGIYVQEGPSDTQAVACDPPTYTGNEFTQGIRPTNACPGGFEPITTQEDCERANNALVAGVFYRQPPTHRGWSTRPRGCFIQVTGYYRLRGYVIFNSNSVGAVSAPDRTICIRSTPVTSPPACPLPAGAWNPDLTIADTTSRGCAPAGYTGNEGANCLNGNHQYATFFDAWEACEVEPECDMVQRWTHWSWGGYRYFMRRSGDRVTNDGEGFTYPCKDQCDGVLNAAATDGGRWTHGAKGETCDQVCSRLGKSCDAAKMTCINTVERIRSAFLEAGHDCARAPDSRDYAGAPFFEHSGSCYYFGQQRNTPAGVVGPQAATCSANLKPWHTALCYCK